MKQKIKKANFKEERFKIREGRFQVAAATSSDTKDESGDSMLTCNLPDGRLAIILSDGMGKGLKAQAESQAVVKLLRKLLKNGVQPSRAIKIVNKRLVGVEESFATVDLTIIDKCIGTASLYKMGATTSFLVRDKKVKKIEQAALPVGMIKSVKASQLKVNLSQEDILVIVSDGITEADKKDLEARWLEEYLIESSNIIGPKIMANEIADIAQSKYTNGERDDISVIVIQIK